MLTHETERKGPLSGITILDFSRVLAGPFCTMLLAELGARVIKIEDPERGDDSRHYGPFVNGESAYFVSINRGKESISINLKDPSQRKILDALIERADVLIENFRPGVMEKFGLSWDEIHAKHPKLVYASISGFGQNGPMRDFPAYDMVVQGMSGIMSINGFPGQPAARIGISIGDLAAAQNAAIAINAALFHRAMTGEATRIDISMFDCQVSLLGTPITAFGATGKVPGPLGDQHPSIAPFGAFATADLPLIIAVGNDKLFLRLADALNAPSLATDSRFLSNAARSDNVDALKSELEAILQSQPRHYWLEELSKFEIPCSPINNIKDIENHPQAIFRNMIVTVEDSSAGPVRSTGNPMKFSNVPDGATRQSAPALDADREKILKELGIKSEN